MTTDNSLQNQFVELIGQFAEMCAFNRSIGQIYGILYLSPEPICLDDIAKACRMSKGNASIHLRTLESWGAVHQIGRPGTRKDYYSANTDLKGLAIKRLQEGIVRRLDHANERVIAIKNDPAFENGLPEIERTHIKKRLAELESILQQAQSGIALLPKLLEAKRMFSL